MALGGLLISISHASAGGDMNRFPAGIILSVASLSIFVVTVANAQSGPEETVSGLMAAWNLKDARAFASQFTEDATFVNVNGALWIGKKDIEDRHAKAGSSRAATQRSSPTACGSSRRTMLWCM
jgi:hypothetical protein